MAQLFRRPSWRRTGGTAAGAAPAPLPGGFHEALFDATYYAATYLDVAESGMEPLAHFTAVGHTEGRRPSAGWVEIERAVGARAQWSATALNDIVSLFPPSRRHMLRSPIPWQRLRKMIHPGLYSAQLPECSDMGVDEVFDHYVSEGVFDGVRPSGLFHPDWYERRLAEESHRPVRPGVEPLFHWLTIGWPRRVVPTPLFDEDFYRASHPDLVRWRHWAFDHYVTRGAFEATRRPSAVVPAWRARGVGRREEQRPLFLDQMLATPTGGQVVDLRHSSQLEDVAIMLKEKLARLAGPTMTALVEKAAAVEPLVRRPYDPRSVNSPPASHGYLHLKEQAESVRRALPFAHYDTIVLTPHCRMAGSARVTGTLTHALADLDPDSRVLVLTTDLSEFERPDWFHESVAVLDLSAYAECLLPDERLRLLLDVVRGFTPQQVINVNSRLGWDLCKVYGGQLSTLTRLGAYLFTWDLDAKGNKGGYPISYFQSCFGSLSWLLLDNAALRDELVDRYSLPHELQQKLRVAYTPVPETGVDHSNLVERRRREGRTLRAFWAGRFDRQKRFDVVVDLARLMPELEIWVWGKTVLGGLDIDFTDLPENIHLKGTYQHFDELPVEDCDFFLYTSEWDGLPTVLIDAGARAVPTVASRVGGVGDVLDEQTGYPVDEALEPEAYVKAINEMIAEPMEATRRAAAFKIRLAETCSWRAYRDVVSLVVTTSAPVSPGPVHPVREGV